MKVYAAKYDNPVRLKSSSGGIFPVLAETIIDNGGVVYGVAMSTDCYAAEFLRVTDKKDLGKLLGSKYLQARLGDTLKLVQKDLTDGCQVLFSGTGCQVNGLKTYLGKEYPNLLTVDVICHGTPSPALWRKYVTNLEDKYGKIESVSFRHKKNGWNNFGLMKNQIYHSKDIDSYMQLFLNNYCLRPSCYECTAKSMKLADISLADFWGIVQIVPKFNDDKGTSLVIIRTAKGQKIFDLISNRIETAEVSYEDGVRKNPAEYKSTGRPILRNTFFVDMNSMDYRSLVDKYIPLKKKIKNYAKFVARKILSGGGTPIKRRSNADYGMLFTFKK